MWRMIWQEKISQTVMVTNIKEQNKRKETRNLTHFQYTTWPDHRVPEADNLVAFHHRIKRSQSLTNTNNTKAPPLLVHCSAGIGRTGTFIALDALSEYCKHANTINVFKYIKKMREEERMNMVQTAVSQ
ncbi:hypothetical protein FSP39_004297 [Pinctada imbricata]|uniref:Uncharacterized protein n=1 Tax=Pinctada imbricata TaxID=66713 RepID=A0AA88YAA2_PINIB|nr:hypothetical protein FSP39_004297 [Pinctada imbricata]